MGHIMILQDYDVKVVILNDPVDLRRVTPVPIPSPTPRVNQCQAQVHLLNSVPYSHDVPQNIPKVNPLLHPLHCPQRLYLLETLQLDHHSLSHLLILSFRQFTQIQARGCRVQVRKLKRCCLVPLDLGWMVPNINNNSLRDHLDHHSRLHLRPRIDRLNLQKHRVKMEELDRTRTHPNLLP